MPGIIDYIKNPEKTDDGRLITSYECDSRIADAEFLFTKKRYADITGRQQENDVIAYHFRQSFRPGEVTPEEANRIGVEFAQRFLKGRHAFIVCTHIDKAHTHITSSGTQPHWIAPGSFATFGAAQKQYEISATPSVLSISFL